VMWRMYREFYLESAKDSYYLKGRAYTPADFERVVSETAGADMSWFFERHVRAPEQPPYDEAFAAVGLRLKRTPAKKQPHTAGIVTDFRAHPLLRVGYLSTGSAAQRAGLRQGDVLVSIGGREVTIDNWQEVLNTFKTGERIPVNVRRGRETVTATLTLGEPDIYEYNIELVENAPAEKRALREAWLSGSGPWRRAPDKPPVRRRNN